MQADAGRTRGRYRLRRLGQSLADARRERKEDYNLPPDDSPSETSFSPSSGAPSWPICSGEIAARHPWREDFPVIEDLRFVLDCAMDGATFYYCAGVMAYYRIHHSRAPCRAATPRISRRPARNITEIQERWIREGAFRASGGLPWCARTIPWSARAPRIESPCLKLLPQASGGSAGLSAENAPAHVHHLQVFRLPERPPAERMVARVHKESAGLVHAAMNSFRVFHAAHSTGF